MPELVQGIDFYYYNIIPPIISSAIKRRCRIKKKKRTARIEVIRMKMYMEDSEVVEALADYSERNFTDLPKWLQHELKARNLTFNTRSPEHYERRVTETDWLEHKVTNHELDLQDINNFVKKGMKYHV